MGYLENVVQAGMVYADRYQLPGYVAKARCSSTAVDLTVGKIDTLLRAHGQPLVENVDSRLDNTLAFASERLEKCQVKKDEVFGMYQQTKSKTLEFVEGKRDETLEFAQGKVSAFCERAEQNKAKVYGKAQEVATSSKAQWESASSKALSGKASLEKHVLQRLEGNAQATKSAKYVIGVADRSLAFGAQLVQKSLLSAQDRLEQTLALTQQVVPKAKACTQALLSRATLLLVACRVQALAVLTKRQELCTLAASYFALATTQAKALRSNFQQGTLQPHLTAQYAQLVEQAQNVYTGVTPYLAEAKQTLRDRTSEAAGFLTAQLEAAKAEVSKLRPLASQVQEKVLPLVRQAQESVLAVLKKVAKAETKAE